MTENGTNTGSRLKAMRELDKKLRPLEEQASDIGAKKSALRKQFTVDTGIVMADFDAARRYACIEDDDMREAKIADFVETLVELSPGNIQLSFDLTEQADGE